MQEQNNPQPPQSKIKVHVGPVKKIDLMSTAYAIGHKNPNRGIKDSISQAVVERLIMENKQIRAEIKDLKYKLKQLK